MQGGSDSISLRSLVATCGDLGAKAGDILREVHFRRLLGGKDGLKVVDKGALQGKSFDPQTIADRRSERLIVRGLKERFGNQLCIVGEETGLADVTRDEEKEQADDDEVHEDEEGDLKTMRDIRRVTLDWWNESDQERVSLSRVCVWIDPLDATREFTEGQVTFCTILIGITLDGESIAGVMIEPFAEQPCIFWGRVDRGCYQTSLNYEYNATTTPLIKSKRIQLGQAFDASTELRVTVSRSRAGWIVQQFTSRLVNILQTKRDMSVQFAFSGGCGYKILQVLKGLADFYPFPCPGTSMWDSCAGDALMASAGGLLTDKRGARLVYDAKRKSFENHLGILCSKDARLCFFAANAISTCLEHVRTVHMEFIGEEQLTKMLRMEQVLCFETPASSLRVDRAESVVEMDLIVTLATGQEKTFRLRRFDALPLIHEAATTRLDGLFAKRAAEVLMYDKVAPLLDSNASKVIYLDRTPSRRAPTVSECLSDKLRETRANKMFLQASSYVVIIEASSASSAGFDSQVGYLKHFHDAMLARQSVTEEVYDSAWRFQELFGVPDENDEEGGDKRMRFSPSLYDEDEEEEVPATSFEASSRLRPSPYAMTSDGESKKKRHRDEEMLRELHRLEEVAKVKTQSKSALERGKDLNEAVVSREEFLMRMTGGTGADVESDFMAEMVERRLQAIHDEVRNVSSLEGNGDELIMETLLQGKGVDETILGEHNGMAVDDVPIRRFVGLRGLWKESLTTLDELHLVTAARSSNKQNELELRMLDLAHLLFIRGVSLVHLEAIHRVYFESMKESAVVNLVKSGLVFYLRRIATSETFQSIFAWDEPVRHRVRLAAKCLADELDATGKLDSSNLDVFSLTSPSKL